MPDIALQTAHDPAAPLDEQQDAMRQAQAAAMPQTVQDMMPMVRFMAEQYEEQAMHKALAKQSLIPYPATARQGKPGMQSVFLDERRIELLGDYYERPGSFNFDGLRTLVDRVPILSSVILTRQRQVKRFCRVQENGVGPGFAIRLKDASAKAGQDEQESMRLLESFFQNCGWERNPRARAKLKRDTFSGFMAKQIRDSLILDSAPIETEWKRDRRLGLEGFYAVDGATIRLCSEQGYEDDDEVFALQVVQGNVRAAYTYDDLIYVPRNPRTDVMVGAYGMSETELLIQTVTGILNATTYNLKYFDTNAIPKGMLNLFGDYSQEDVHSFKRYWNAMVKGINNAWGLPVMVSKNQESKAEFVKFGVDVDEMMFAKWITFLTSIVCAIYGIAPDEINFESFTSGSTTPLSGSDTEEKLINSKDKGLRPLLSHFEDLFTDYIVQEFGDKYVFRWTGLDEKSAEQQWAEEQALSTVNEARKARGMDEIKESWGDAPLNQALMGAYMASQQQAGEDYGTPGGGEPGQFGGQGGDDQEDGAKDQQEPPQEEDDAQPDDDMAKALGLPVWRPEP